MLTAEEKALLFDCLPFLKKLDGADRLTLESAVSGADFSKGELILSRDRECSGLVFVKSGQLRAFFETEDGKETTLYRLLPRDVCILTASCALKNIRFEVTLEAERESRVSFIPASVWAQFSEKYPFVREFSMELVSERFSEVMWVMEQMISKNMGQRLAAFLLGQQKLLGTDTLELTHETVAKNLGTAREVVSRVLKYFENEGAIRLSRGQIVIADLAKLEAMGR